MHKSILVPICWTVFINFCIKTFCKIHELFPYKSPEGKFDLAIKKLKVKNHQNFPWNLTFKHNPIIDLAEKNGQGQPKINIKTNFAT